MTDPLFDAAFEIVVGLEGALSMVATDPGNWTGGKIGEGALKGTKYGISAAQFPDLDIENLSLEDAKQLYLAKYWTPHRCGDMPWKWALAIFDAEVNQGRGVKWAQLALSVVDDGEVGAETLSAMKARYENDAFLGFIGQRIEAYAKGANFAKDGYGWLRRVTRIVQQGEHPPQAGA